MLNLFEVGRVTGVLSSQVPSASERDSVVAVCVRCETNIQQAHKGAVIAYVLLQSHFLCVETLFIFGFLFTTYLLCFLDQTYMLD